MIVGVGTDLVRISELADQLRRPGTVFAHAFTGAERRTASARSARTGSPDDHLAARWAGKESVIKAWSAALAGQAPPIDPGEVTWSEIEIVVDPWGRPSISLHGAIRDSVPASLADTYGPGTAHWHVSLSHDGDYATATALLDWRAD